MIRTLRALFLGRLLREKLLLLCFLLLGVLMWLSGYSKRFGSFWREQRTTTSTLAEQQRWLVNEKAISDSARKSAARLDASKTLDGTRLLATLSQLADETGVKKNAISGAPKDQRGDQFSVHTVNYQINRSDWGSLQKFYVALSARSPYIGIETFALQADRADPNLLTLALTVSAVEIAR
jgi:hypothetical protein